LTPKHENASTSFWDERRGMLRTRKGGWVIDEAVYTHGYSLLDDLFGRASFVQVLILNVTGRMVERRLADWIEAIFLTVSYPDARIWCNHIGSLAGTMRGSPVAAVSAGLLASDSRMYGPGTIYGGAAFIAKALVLKRKGLSAEEIVDEYIGRRPDAPPVIPGYVRPVARGDERVAALERLTRQLGFERGEHLSLAYEIQDVMARRYNEGMNNLAYHSAFLCDQGFAPMEHYRILSAVVHSGVNACYSEAYDLPPESFLPLRCDDIDYQGEPPRPVPGSDQEAYQGK